HHAAQRVEIDRFHRPHLGGRGTVAVSTIGECSPGASTCRHETVCGGPIWPSLASAYGWRAWSPSRTWGPTPPARRSTCGNGTWPTPRGPLKSDSVASGSPSRRVVVDTTRRTADASTRKTCQREAKKLSARPVLT